MELVKVKNLHPKNPLILRNDQDGDVTIKPKSEQIVPVKYAVLAFGNPNAVNNGNDKQRDVEYGKVLVRWGWYEGVDQGHTWEDIAPQYEVYDMDDNRIYMLLEDPKGEQSNKSKLNLEGEQSNAFVAGRIDELEAQIVKLTQLLAKNADEDASVGAAVPEPTGTTPEDVFDPSKDAESINAAAAAQESQEERNKGREELPPAKPSKPKKDAPGTTRVGNAK
jgi:hypothetical protein